MDSKQLNSNELFVKLESIQEYCNKYCNGIDFSFSICKQLKEIEKIIVEKVSKTTSEKINDSRLNIQLIALREDPVYYTHEKIRKKRVNRLDHKTIHSIF